MHCLLCLVSFAPLRAADTSNPVMKVIQLLADLSASLENDGDIEGKAYKKYFEWCDDSSASTQFEIKKASSQKAKLEAKIMEATSDISVASSKIEDLAGAITTTEVDLKAAEGIRKKEAEDFAASEQELLGAISAIGRAIDILQREMQKGTTAVLQLSSADLEVVMQSLSVIIDAAALPNSDRQQLVALVQSHEGTNEEDTSSDAPSEAAYKTHSAGIVDTLEDLREKAEGQLNSLRNSEVSSKHSFEMLKQSLLAKKKADEKDMSTEKSAKAAATEVKSSASGDLEVATKELKSAQQSLATLQASCMQVAADHDASIKSREEEVKVVNEARKTLQSMTAGAVDQTYTFIQVSSTAMGNAIQRSQVVGMVKQLAITHHSAALAQLASRIAAVARYGTGSNGDPFAKVKGLIESLIAKLEQEAEDDAAEKAYCDDEMRDTKEKKGELEDETAKMTSKIDQAAAKSADLKEQVKELSSELGQLARERAKLAQLRQDQHGAYLISKAHLEKGLTGVRSAINMLRNYYAAEDDDASFIQDGSSEKDRAMMEQPKAPESHSKKDGAGAGIIGVLEVIESDFATNLAKVETEENDAASEYERISHEKQVSSAQKEADVKFKTQEFTSLDKAINELFSDRETANRELAAVMEYFDKLQDRCVAKPETYEERKKRRDAEIAGLQEALEALKGEAALVQRATRHRGSLRGAPLEP